LAIKAKLSLAFLLVALFNLHLLKPTFQPTLPPSPLHTTTEILPANSSNLEEEFGGASCVRLRGKSWCIRFSSAPSFFRYVSSH